MEGGGYVSQPLHKQLGETKEKIPCSNCNNNVRFRRISLRRNRHDLVEPPPPPVLP